MDRTSQRGLRVWQLDYVSPPGRDTQLALIWEEYLRQCCLAHTGCWMEQQEWI